MTDNTVTDGTFQREERYIVAKLGYLTEGQEFRLRRFLANCEQPERRYVVVESDWPEYEDVWAMIEARCTGKPLQSTTTLTKERDDLRAEVERLRRLVPDAFREGYNNGRRHPVGNYHNDYSTSKVARALTQSEGEGA